MPSRKGVPNAATRLITDDFGRAVLYRRCGYCRSWLPQAIGQFSPRRRDPETRRVVRWDNRCLACRALTRRQEWATKPKAERQAIARRRWEKLKTDAEALEQRRQDNRKHMANRRKDPKVAERHRQSHRDWYQRIKKDPKKYAAYLERSRMNYRLAQERAGRDLSTIKGPKDVAHATKDDFPRLPARPLAEAIDRLLEALQGDVTNTEEFLVRNGISARSFLAWSKGERQSVSSIVADMAITRLGLNWWEIWPPKQYPKANRVFGDVNVAA